MNRRQFLRSSLMTAATLPLVRTGFAESGKRPLGVQLYTVRDQAEKDLPRVLAQIQAIGYQEVETYWNVYSHPAAELRRMISDAGLRAPSGHFDYDGLPGKLEYARELGVEYVICPMLPQRLWNSAAGFRQAAEHYNQWAAQAKKMDMRFGHHNHNYEFRRFDNTTGFDLLMENTDPELVWLEMDCYWITQAGRNPVEFLKKYPKRIRMLHLKDRKPGFPPSTELNAAAGHFTEVGNGSIRWKPILESAQKNGVEHLFVEQDECERPPVESLRISYQYLQKIMRG